MVCVHPCRRRVSGPRKGVCVLLFFLEACLSNQVVRISAVGAIAHQVSHPANDLCYCRVSLFEGKDYDDGF